MIHARDVIVLFDATGCEADDRSNVWRMGNLVHGVPLYEPGVGTRLGPLAIVGSTLGLGKKDRIDDQLDRLAYWPTSRVSVIGGSRGAHYARLFTERFNERYQRKVFLCLMLDHVAAQHWQGVKRLAPAGWWSPQTFRRPPAKHVVHVRAAGRSHRFYEHDDVQADFTTDLPDFNHHDALFHPAALSTALGWCAFFGLEVPEDRWLGGSSAA